MKTEKIEYEGSLPNHIKFITKVNNCIDKGDCVIIDFTTNPNMEFFVKTKVSINEKLGQVGKLYICVKHNRVCYIGCED